MLQRSARPMNVAHCSCNLLQLHHKYSKMNADAAINWNAAWSHDLWPMANLLRNVYIYTLPCTLTNLCHTHTIYSHAARRHSGRLYLLFLTSILHGITVECLSYVLPDVDNFWHGVSSIMFFKERLPLHILLFCEFVCVCVCWLCQVHLTTWRQQVFCDTVSDVLV